MQRDTEIFELIDAEKNRQLNGLELIASENFVSDQVMEAAGSILTNKYAEGYPNKRYYGGCQIVDIVEQLAIDRAKELYGAEYANVQPHSGSQANTAVFHACLNPGDRILGFDLSHGGHLTHGSPVNFSGKLYEPHFYGVEKETGVLNYDNISHPSGMIAKGILNDPLPHCHVVTTTTHKTLRGPRGGLILMGKDFDNPFGLKLKNGKLKKMSALLNGGVFPGNQGGPLEHIIAAKAIAFSEALSDEFLHYQIQVKKNAAAMAKSFVAKGYDLIITVNKNMVPFDDKSPFVTSGIRIGTPAVTTRGLKENDMETIVEFIDAVINDYENEETLATIANKVHKFMSHRPLFVS